MDSAKTNVVKFSGPITASAPTAGFAFISAVPLSFSIESSLWQEAALGLWVK